MPLVQGGPPEWLWERTTGPLKWEVTHFERQDGEKGYRLTVRSGLEIFHLQLFNKEELREVALAVNAHL